MRYDRGDGACGKTSLLNVFTRGYVSFQIPLGQELGVAREGMLMNWPK